MLLACMMANVSCEEEDSWDAWVNKETLVVYEISCNTPGVPVELSDICYNPSRLQEKVYSSQQSVKTQMLLLRLRYMLMVSWKNTAMETNGSKWQYESKSVTLNTLQHEPHDKTCVYTINGTIVYKIAPWLTRRSNSNEKCHPVAGWRFFTHVQKISNLYLEFYSLLRTFELTLESTPARIFPNKFGKSLAYSYLCRQKGGIAWRNSYIL